MIRIVPAAFLIASAAACASGGGTSTSRTAPADVASAAAPSAPADARNTPDYNVSLSASQNVNPDTVSLPADIVWERLPKAYAALGLVIDAADPRAQALGTARQRLHGYLSGTPLGRYLDCGRSVSGDNVDTHEVELRVRSTVETAGVNRAVIRTVLAAVAGQSGAGQSAFRCTTTRHLEQRLIDFVLSGAEK